jgi:hypothetical protein
MKYISTLILMLTLICPSQYYSQRISKEAKDHHLKVRKNSKGLSLEVKDLKTVEKNGKTSWTVKTILTNHSRDTLFYFGTPDCEQGGYMVYSGSTMADSIPLFIDYKNCGTTRSLPQTVIAVPPSGKRTVNLEIISQKPSTCSKFSVCLSIYKAKNMNERNPNYDVMRIEGDREVWLVSKRIKT